MRCKPLSIGILVLAASGAPCGEPSRAKPFDEYRVVLWTGDSASKDPARLPLFFQRLREMGANAGMVYGGGDPAHLVANGMPYYVENVVNRGLCLKWSSKVTDWERKHLGKTDRITLRLDPWRPSLFALLDEEVPAEGIVEHLLKP